MPANIPFVRELDVDYGRVDQVSPLIRRVIADNPSSFTAWGTGTYIIGQGNVAVVDPGPLDDNHLNALEAALDGETITHLLITHTHLDHSPLAAPMKEKHGAPTFGYGPHGAGKYEQGVIVEEGGDMDFTPDERVTHGDVIEGDGWSVECVYTPGHTSNHICFALREEEALFSGDHVMGWSTTIVSPPDGDMREYVESLDLLLGRADSVYWPTHGAAIEEPQTYVTALRAHREERAQQVLSCLRDGLTKLVEMVPRMYAGDVPQAMYPAAARSVFSTLIWLIERGEAAVEGQPAVRATYGLA